jgi:hypothetical protein
MALIEITQWIAAAAAVAAVLWAHLSLRTSVRALKASVDESRYSQLDSAYFELLRLRIDNPVLSGPRPRTKHGQIAWDNYACCVWNFIETVVDYCDAPGRNFLAWAPAVKHESAAYAGWMTGENLNRYRPDFMARVGNLLDRHESERATMVQ